MEKDTEKTEKGRKDVVLRLLLATPPDHKQGTQAKANPKKRGRPPRALGGVKKEA